MRSAVRTYQCELEDCLQNSHLSLYDSHLNQFSETVSVSSILNPKVDSREHLMCT
jgi:hypothetical protein